MGLLAGDGTQLRSELLSMGVEPSHSDGKKRLQDYIQSQRPERKIRCVLQVGWTKDAFVLPDEVFGPAANEVVYQSHERGHEEHTQSGTLEDWKSSIAHMAIGNPLLTFALSAAFAGPLLAKTNSESGGFHFVGDSSTGKTTLIEAACSVWGGSNFKRSWRATANGMEGVAALFNDCLLALDEISQCDPKEVGSIIYTLGNGRGKQLASRNGGARSVPQFRCLVLSSGERSIETAIAESGQKVKAGQSVRLLDIPVNRSFGAWDVLHSASTAANFSDQVKQASGAFHGTAGRAFLKALTFDKSDFSELLNSFKVLEHFVAHNGDGQEKRAAARFALVALAGEQATEYGLTGWARGEALQAAQGAYQLWQSTRSKGNSEPQQILEQVLDFIQRHGDSRFSDFEETEQTKVQNRAGWWCDTRDGREYRFTSSGLREALKSFDFKRSLKVLVEAGAIPEPPADGEKARPFRVGGAITKLYPVNPEYLEGVGHVA
jgi:putative DNA primase/helicase